MTDLRECCGAEGTRQYWAAGAFLASGVALGGLMMYLCDPSRGKMRRARVRQQAESAIRQAGRDLTGKAEDLLNRSRGMIAEAKGAMSCHAEADDEVVAGRVRSRMGHITRHAHAIETTVQNGVVTLHGILPEEERKCVMAEIRRIPGVRDVQERLACEIPA